MIELPCKARLPTESEFSLFSAERWLEFLQYIDFHIEMMKKRSDPIKDCYNVTTDKLMQLKDYSIQSDHPWLEFLNRTDITNETKYPVMVRTFNVKAMKFLEVRPSLVTEQMKEIMVRNKDLMGKYLRVASDIVPVAVEGTPLPPIGTVNTMQAKQLAIITDSVEYLQTLITEAKKRKVSDLSLKDILSAMPKIVDSINKMQNRQVKTGSLTQININGSAQDMEEGMLAFINKSQNIE